MQEVNVDWASQQLAAARVRQGVADSVLALLAAWREMEHKPDDSAEVLDLFSRLALSNSLTPENPEETWVDARPGFISVGDVVRVKHNAYAGKAGITHNGRRGKVVAIRYGDIIFRSTDDITPFLDGTHHSPYKLEKRIK